jgi:hypothetical protein
LARNLANGKVFPVSETVGRPPANTGSALMAKLSPTASSNPRRLISSLSALHSTSALRKIHRHAPRLVAREPPVDCRALLLLTGTCPGGTLHPSGSAGLGPRCGPDSGGSPRQLQRSGGSPWTRRLNGAYAGWASDRSPTIGREAAMGGIRDRPCLGADSAPGATRTSICSIICMKAISQKPAQK